MKVVTMESLPLHVRPFATRIEGENVSLKRNVAASFRQHQVSIPSNIGFGIREHHSWSPSNNTVIYSTEFAKKDQYAVLPRVYNCEFVKSAGISGGSEYQVSIKDRLWPQVPGDLARQIALTELGALRSSGYPSGVRIYSENRNNGISSEAIAEGGIDLSVFGDQLKTIAPFGDRIDLSGIQTRFRGAWTAGDLSDGDMNLWAVSKAMEHARSVLTYAIQKALPGIFTNILDEQVGAPYYSIG